MGENILKGKGLRPNWDEHNAAKCPKINYFADRNNTALILTKQENEIGNTCYFCNTCKKCSRLKECRAKFKRLGFWTFNKHVKLWNVFDPEWSNKSRIFPKKVVV